jgi:hypothetical protein
MAGFYRDPRTGIIRQGSARIANLKMLMGSVAPVFLFGVIYDYMDSSWLRSIFLFALGSWALISLYGLFEIWDRNYWFKPSTGSDIESNGLNEKRESAKPIENKERLLEIKTMTQLNDHLNEMGFVVYLSETASRELQCQDKFEPWKHSIPLARIIACSDEYKLLTRELRNARFVTDDKDLSVAKIEGLQLAAENLRSMAEEIESLEDIYEKDFSPKILGDAFSHVPQQIEDIRSEITAKFYS